jgi:hypothetical protein
MADDGSHHCARCALERVCFASQSGSWYVCLMLQVRAMEPKALRRTIVALGLPGAGTPSKLQQRALAIAEAVERGESLAAGVEAARRLR